MPELSGFVKESVKTRQIKGALVSMLLFSPCTSLRGTTIVSSLLMLCFQWENIQRDNELFRSQHFNNYILHEAGSFSVVSKML